MNKIIGLLLVVGMILGLSFEAKAEDLQLLNITEYEKIAVKSYGIKATPEGYSEKELAHLAKNVVVEYRGVKKVNLGKITNAIELSQFGIDNKWRGVLVTKIVIAPLPKEAVGIELLSSTPYDDCIVNVYGVANDDGDLEHIEIVNGDKILVDPKELVNIVIDTQDDYKNLVKLVVIEKK